MALGIKTARKQFSKLNEQADKVTSGVTFGATKKLNEHNETTESKQNEFVGENRPGVGKIVQSFTTAPITHALSAAAHGIAAGAHALALPFAAIIDTAAGLSKGLGDAFDKVQQAATRDPLSTEAAPEAGERKRLGENYDYTRTKTAAKGIATQTAKTVRSGAKAALTPAAAAVEVGAAVTAGGLALAAGGTAVGLGVAAGGVVLGTGVTAAAVSGASAATAITTSAVAGAVTRTAVDGPKGLVTGTKDGIDQAVKALKGQDKRGEAQGVERTSTAGKISKAFGNSLKAPINGTYNAAIEGATKKLANENKDIKNIRIAKKAIEDRIDLDDPKAAREFIKAAREIIKSERSSKGKVKTAKNAAKAVSAFQNALTPTEEEAVETEVAAKPKRTGRLAGLSQRVFGRKKSTAPQTDSPKNATEAVETEVAAKLEARTQSENFADFSSEAALEAFKPLPKATSGVIKHSGSFGEQVLKDKENRIPGTLAL